MPALLHTQLHRSRADDGHKVTNRVTIPGLKAAGNGAA